MQVPCFRRGVTRSYVMQTGPPPLSLSPWQTHTNTFAPSFFNLFAPSLLLWSDRRGLFTELLFMFSYNSLSLCLCSHLHIPTQHYSSSCENTRRMFTLTLLSFLVWFYDRIIHVMLDYELDNVYIYIFSMFLNIWSLYSCENLKIF